MKLTMGICIQCGSEFLLRKNAKYCNNKCKSDYNNKKKKDSLSDNDRLIANQLAKKQRKESRINRPERHIFYRIRNKCKRYGIDFNLDFDDIIIPDKCPLLEIPFKNHEIGHGIDTPSVDRIDSSKGYIKGNVWIISLLANRMKQDASIETLKTFSKNVLNRL